jgi:hypothetical protein
VTGCGLSTLQPVLLPKHHNSGKETVMAELNTQSVVAVLLADGMHNVQNFEPVSLTGQMKWPAAFRWTENGQFVTVPASSILGLRQAHLLSADELAAVEAERKAEREAAAERLFVWQHYASSDVFMTQAETQNWKCEDCQAPLENFPHTHYLAGRNVVLCQNCSPLKPHFGDPT